MTATCDFLVIGAGMAGASAAYNLAEHGSVIMLEGENAAGYHSTGRSAAMFLETYGNETIRALARSSRNFLEHPPEGFADGSLLSKRGVLHIARSEQVERLQGFADELAQEGAEYKILSGDQVRQLVPIIRDGYVSKGLLEPGAMDIDVHALHQGFLSGYRARGGRLQTSAMVEKIKRDGASWTVETRDGAYSSPVVINAAGAWAEAVGALADAAPIGLVPKRRTAFNLALPDEFSPGDWPLIHDIDETFYFKPDAGQLLLSPADETPHAPCDIQPEELDVAMAVDRFERATTLNISHIPHRWAGLRSFVADNSLVAGFDGQIDGFFWVAGQGGYGIQTAPAMGRIVSGLIVSGEIPADISAEGLKPSDLDPQRLVREQRLPAAIADFELEQQLS